MTPTTACTRRLMVVAQDPGVRTEGGRFLCVPIEIPAEVLDAGPWGHRVQVIDFTHKCRAASVRPSMGSVADRCIGRTLTRRRR